MERDQETQELIRAIREHDALDTYRLLLYEPYEKQRQFHALGATKRERMLAAGNRCGKSEAGGMEAAMHATGLYPDWWQGKRFTKPTRGWIASISNELTRDVAQAKVYGPLEAPGTGSIPASKLRSIDWYRGIPNFLDTLLVEHVSGGVSYISFKSFEQGELKFQGSGLDWIWLDEEAPPKVYSECLARIAERKGTLYTTFTPLLGMTEVASRFFPEPQSSDMGLVRMEIEEALHIDPEEREKIVASYPLHERESRAKGIPMQGSGRVFPIAESMITIEPFPIPEWWPRLCGLDFGWTHPTASVWMAINPETKGIVVYDCYRQKEQTPVVHAAAIRARGEWIPVAWPKDGYEHDSTGIALATQYREQGCRVIPDHAQFASGSTGVEAGLMLMLDWMKTGRFHVFRTCLEWFEEFRFYHRKDGEVVKEKDDLMAATRYAFMMMRFAREKTPEVTLPPNAGMDYDPLG